MTENGYDDDDEHDAQAAGALAFFLFPLFFFPPDGQWEPGPFWLSTLAYGSLTKW